MKKIFLFIFIFFLFLIKVTALVNIEVSKPVIRFPKEEEYVLQGFTNVDNRLFAIFIEPSGQKPKVKIFNLNNGKLIKEFITDDLGHANDVTYNKKTNQIYVANGDGKSFLHVFDADDYGRIQLEITLPIRSITYIDDKDLYAVRTVTSGFYLNNDFSLKSKVPFIIGMNFSSDIGRQGWTYYNGLIYYSTWSWIRHGGDGSNKIYVYTISGERTDEIVTNNEIGELEDVSFYNDKMILGFNTYDDYIEFYMIDNPKVNTKVVVQEEHEEPKKEIDKHKIVYAVIEITAVIILLILFARKKM